MLKHAAMAAQLDARNVPIMLRNSPGKLLVPGSPMLAMVKTMNRSA